MTLEEIKADLSKMAKAMGAAGCNVPSAELWLRSDSGPLLHLSGLTTQPNYEFLRGGDEAEVIAKGWAFIRALPDPEIAVLNNYSRKLADAIDYGHGNNLPAKLVDPVRRAQKAASDMLLPAPVQP